MKPFAKFDRGAPLNKALMTIFPAARTAFAFGFFINLLLFVSPLYMLQIYDRVIPSRNSTTLIGLTVIALYLIAIYAALEMLRGRIMSRASVAFDKSVGRKVFTALHRSQLAQPGVDRGQTLRDVDTLRDLVAGPGLTAIADARWTPLFIGVCFMMHPWFGVLGIVAACLLVGLTLLSEMRTTASLRAANQASARASAYAEAGLRNGEALQAMNMLAPIRAGWARFHDDALQHGIAAGEKGGQIAAATKFVRLALQTAILGFGAYLAIQREISPGTMIAASIIIGRMLAPVEVIIGHWKHFTNARGAYRRLSGLLDAYGAEPARVALPRPQGRLELEQVAIAPPGGRQIVLQGVTFTLEAGESLGVVGPSSAGKSCLARVLCGVWSPVAGALRLDGAELKHWDPEALGDHIGYLPQDVELFAGSVAQNIARFRPDADDAAIIEIARLAGCHDMIQRLPEGYNTQIGEGGAALSGGQRQRIGLARAFFGMPALVVLDEPNANLDAEGEASLLAAMRRFRNAGTTIVVITHRPSMLAGVDKVLVLAEGRPRLFGERDEVLAKITPTLPAIAA